MTDITGWTAEQKVRGAHPKVYRSTSVSLVWVSKVACEAWINDPEDNEAEDAAGYLGEHWEEAEQHPSVQAWIDEHTHTVAAPLPVEGDGLPAATQADIDEAKCDPRWKYANVGHDALVDIVLIKRQLREALARAEKAEADAILYEKAFKAAWLDGAANVGDRQLYLRMAAESIAKEVALAVQPSASLKPEPETSMPAFPERWANWDVHGDSGMELDSAGEYVKVTEYGTLRDYALVLERKVESLLAGDPAVIAKRAVGGAK